MMNGGGRTTFNDYLGSPNNTMTPTKQRPSRNVTSSDGTKLFTVWPMSLDTRECNDIVHTSVSIPPAVQIILDSPPVQRLVNLKQLGCAFNTYPCATHTRKEHSLGVMELAGKVGIHLQSEQPTLGITDKDILCLRMAGLCHDLGHGPNSHVYESFLKAVYKNEHDHPELYEERDRQFKSEFGIDMPPLPRHYEHERTSLMMIDFALASVGLEIDWNRLDEPLKQIGNGIDCDKFGVVGRNTNDECIPFTSRDWIFIKECIMATPLDTPDAPSRQLTFIGRPEKEYLYDIVSNRYSGLDVDKIDYYDRDSLAAFGSKRGELQVFLREATVAWGKCPDIKQSYKCMSHPIDPELNLMICYPSKLVEAAMDFFSQRKKNHAAIYTHKKTKAAELQMVDLLLEADKHYSMLFSCQVDDQYAFPLPSRFEHFPFHRLPISRSWMYPRLFLRMDDTISSIIENKVMDIPPSQLGRLRQLINDRRAHKFYKRVGEIEIGHMGGNEFWNLSEDEMKDELLNDYVSWYGEPAKYTSSNSIVMTLHPEDFIVEKRELHYGCKETNPVSRMRFLSKNIHKVSLKNSILELPIAEEVHTLSMDTPRAFVKRTVRVFCRTPEKNEMLSHVFLNWVSNKEDKLEAGPNCVLEAAFPFMEVGEVSMDGFDDTQRRGDTLPITQDEYSSRKRECPKGGDSCAVLDTATKRLFPGK